MFVSIDELSHFHRLRSSVSSNCWMIPLMVHIIYQVFETFFHCALVVNDTTLIALDYYKQRRSPTTAKLTDKLAAAWCKSNNLN